MLLKAVDKAIGCDGMDFVSTILRIVFIIKTVDFVLEPMFGLASNLIGILLAIILSRIHFTKLHEHMAAGKATERMDTEKLTRTVALAKVLNQKSSSMVKT